MSDPTPPTVELDATDRRLLDRLQVDIPVVDRPFEVIGSDVGLDEAGTIRRVARLKSGKIIRQISPIFDTVAMGYTSVLVAAKVAEARIEDAARQVNGHPGVSHNYQRNAAYNLWFTFAVPPGKSLEDELKKLAEAARLDDVVPLPVVRTFRIGVRLAMSEDDEAPASPTGGPAMGSNRATQAVPLTETDKQAIRVTQNDLPIIERPFGGMCDQLGIDITSLSSWFERMKKNGVLRRYAAILHHRRAGFSANGMGVWRMPEERIEEAGRLAAAVPEVTHCYQRRCYDAWPYNLYTMIHARSVERCDEIAAALAKTLAPLGLIDRGLLYSSREFKKVRLRYFEEASE